MRFPILLLLLILARPLSAQVINEVQASNATTIADDFGEFPDWIEIANPGNTPIDLNGYGLSDRPDNPYKWTFPSVVIQPGHHLIVWASGRNRRDPTRALHTNYSISAEGESIVLTAPGNVRKDLLEGRYLSTGISVGRQPDGSGPWVYFKDPTPGAVNTSTGYPRLVLPPTFSKEGGSYLTSVTLTLTAEADAQIHYTTDGSVPVPGVSQRYTGPITFTTSQRIRAIASRAGDLPSPTLTHTYVRVSSTIPTWSSNLPIVVLMQHNLPITSGEKTPASMILIDRGADGRARLAGPTTLHSRVDADIRGSSSQSFPQKMYGVELRDELNGNRDEALLGMPADHNWILYAPYGEKSLMRNVLAYQMAADFGRWAPRTRFVELFLHSGTGSVNQSQYMGVYILLERIKWGAHRVDVTQVAPGDNDYPDVTGGYIIRKDRLNAGESGFWANRGHRMAYYRPGELEMTSTQKQYVKDSYDAFETALYSADYRDPSVGYAAHIDVDSFIDHFLITEYLKEIDGYRLSTFLHKDRGGKWVMGPVWDFNLSAGNADYLKGWLTTGWYYSELGPGNHCAIDCLIRDQYVRLLTDPAFVSRMRQRWWELRAGAWSPASLMARIDAHASEVNEAQARHYAKWTILGQYVWPNQPGYWMLTSYMDEVNWMKNWLLQRMIWMDAQMGANPGSEERPLATYWHIGTNVANDTPLTQVPPVFPAASQARITFESALEGYPFTSAHPDWRKASLERRNSPTDVNYRAEGRGGSAYSASAMRGLQVKQPFRRSGRENALILHLPTTGLKDVVLSFAALNENGAQWLVIDYSVAAGAPVWTAAGLNQSLFPISDSWRLIEVDFRHVNEADGNPDFKVRIRFDGENLEADNGDRVTFNNISLDHRLTTTAIDTDGEAPAVFALEPNVPNPFNPSTVVRWQLAVGGQTSVKVYDLLGREVAVLIDGAMPAGRHEAVFDGRGLASGVYLVRLQAGGEVFTRKMMLMK